MSNLRNLFFSRFKCDKSENLHFAMMFALLIRFSLTDKIWSFSAFKKFKDSMDSMKFPSDISLKKIRNHNYLSSIKLIWTICFKMVGRWLRSKFYVLNTKYQSFNFWGFYWFEYFFPSLSVIFIWMSKKIFYLEL